MKDAIANNHPLESVDADLPTQSKDAVDETPGLTKEGLSILALFALIGFFVFIAGTL